MLIIRRRVLPLLPIFAPGSISVTSMPNVLILPNISVQTLNFSRSLDVGNTLIGPPGYTFNFANIQGSGALFNAYTGPSPRATGLVHSTVYGGDVLLPNSPCGANCSFTQSFNGPAYQCHEIDFTKDVESRNPFCRDITSCGKDHWATPTMNAFDIYWYTGRNSSGDTCDGCLGEPWQDGKIWIEYQYLQSAYRLQEGDPPRNSTPIPESGFEKHQILCQSYNATYSIKRSYVDFQPIIEGNIR